jgi:hypothetical protein
VSRFTTRAAAAPVDVLARPGIRFDHLENDRHHDPTCQHTSD